MHNRSVINETDEAVTRGLQAAADGKSLKKIAFAMGIEYPELCKLLKNNPFFAKELQEFREMALHAKADELMTLADEEGVGVQRPAERHVARCAARAAEQGL